MEKPVSTQFEQRLFSALRFSLSVSVSALALPWAVVQANPVGESVQSGSATFSRPDSNTLNVNQHSDKLITNWQDFSIQNGETTNFNQPNVGSAALNRVIGDNLSQIHGNLNANGKVILVNPRGITFGENGRVDAAGGFVGSTLDVDNQQFLNGGDLNFQGSAGTIINKGQINSDKDVFLFAHDVDNQGKVNAGGTAGLAAGKRILLQQQGAGDGRVQVQVGGGAVNHSGEIQAAIAELKANGGDPNSLAVNIDGVIRANGTKTQGGRVMLNAGGGQARVAGRIDASSQTGRGGHISVKGAYVNIKHTADLDVSGLLQGGRIELGDRNTQKTHVSGRVNAASSQGKGGQVKVSGKKIHVKSGADINASGRKGGGQVHVGGGWQGKDAAHKNSVEVEFDQFAKINVDSTGSGNAGQAVVWADKKTTFKGQISAQVKGSSGNGGQVEVSGKQTLNFQGLVNTQAKNGEIGDLLLDPENLKISSAAGGGTTGANEITDADVELALQFSNVTLNTSAALATDGNDSDGDTNPLTDDETPADTTVLTGAGADAGDITVDAGVDITWATASTLTLLADQDVKIEDDVMIQNTQSSNSDQDGVTTGNLDNNVGNTQLVDHDNDPATPNVAQDTDTYIEAHDGIVIQAGGDVVLGKATDRTGDVAVGSEFGNTVITADGDVTITGGVSADNTTGYSTQLGYRIDDTRGASSTNADAIQDYAGDRADENGTPLDYDHAKNGDITITAGGSVTVTGAAEQSDTEITAGDGFAQIGHGGEATVDDATTYDIVDSDITINAGMDVKGDVLLDGGSTEKAFAQVGHGTFNQSADGTDKSAKIGQGDISGDINIYVGNKGELKANTAAPIPGRSGGHDQSIAQVGHGGHFFYNGNGRDYEINQTEDYANLTAAEKVIVWDALAADGSDGDLMVALVDAGDAVTNLPQSVLDVVSTRADGTETATTVGDLQTWAGSATSAELTALTDALRVAGQVNVLADLAADNATSNADVDSALQRKVDYALNSEIESNKADVEQGRISGNIAVNMDGDADASNGILEGGAVVLGTSVTADAPDDRFTLLSQIGHGAYSRLNNDGSDMDGLEHTIHAEYGAIANFKDLSGETSRDAITSGTDVGVNGGSVTLLAENNASKNSADLSGDVTDNMIRNQIGHGSVTRMDSVDTPSSGGTDAEVLDPTTAVTGTYSVDISTFDAEGVETVTPTDVNVGNLGYATINDIPDPLPNTLTDAQKEALGKFLAEKEAALAPATAGTPATALSAVNGKLNIAVTEGDIAGNINITDNDKADGKGVDLTSGVQVGLTKITHDTMISRIGHGTGNFIQSPDAAATDQPDDGDAATTTDGNGVVDASETFDAGDVTIKQANIIGANINIDTLTQGTADTANDATEADEQNITLTTYNKAGLSPVEDNNAFALIGHGGDAYVYSGNGGQGADADSDTYGEDATYGGDVIITRGSIWDGTVIENAGSDEDRYVYGNALTVSDNKDDDDAVDHALSDQVHGSGVDINITSSNNVVLDADSAAALSPAKRNLSTSSIGHGQVIMVATGEGGAEADSATGGRAGDITISRDTVTVDFDGDHDTDGYDVTDTDGNVVDHVVVNNDHETDVAGVRGDINITAMNKDVNDDANLQLHAHDEGALAIAEHNTDIATIGNGGHMELYTNQGGDGGTASDGTGANNLSKVADGGRGGDIWVGELGPDNTVQELARNEEKLEGDITVKVTGGVDIQADTTQALSGSKENIADAGIGHNPRIFANAGDGGDATKQNAAGTGEENLTSAQGGRGGDIEIHGPTITDRAADFSATQEAQHTEESDILVRVTDTFDGSDESLLVKAYTNGGLGEKQGDNIWAGVGHHVRLYGEGGEGGDGGHAFSDFDAGKNLVAVYVDLEVNRDVNGDDIIDGNDTIRVLDRYKIAGIDAGSDATGTTYVKVIRDEEGTITGYKDQNDRLVLSVIRNDDGTIKAYRDEYNNNIAMRTSTSADEAASGYAVFTDEHGQTMKVNLDDRQYAYNADPDNQLNDVRDVDGNLVDPEQRDTDGNLTQAGDRDNVEAVHTVTEAEVDQRNPGTQDINTQNILSTDKFAAALLTGATGRADQNQDFDADGVIDTSDSRFDGQSIIVQPNTSGGRGGDVAALNGDIAGDIVIDVDRQVHVQTDGGHGGDTQVIASIGHGTDVVVITQGGGDAGDQGDDDTGPLHGTNNQVPDSEHSFYWLDGNDDDKLDNDSSVTVTVTDANGQQHVVTTKDALAIKVGDNRRTDDDDSNDIENDNNGDDAGNDGKLIVLSLQNIAATSRKTDADGNSSTDAGGYDADLDETLASGSTTQEDVTKENQLAAGVNPGDTTLGKGGDYTTDDAKNVDVDGWIMIHDADGNPQFIQAGVDSDNNPVWVPNTEENYNLYVLNQDADGNDISATTVPGSAGAETYADIKTNNSTYFGRDVESFTSNAYSSNNNAVTQFVLVNTAGKTEAEFAADNNGDATGWRAHQWQYNANYDYSNHNADNPYQTVYANLDTDLSSAGTVDVADFDGDGQFDIMDIDHDGKQDAIDGILTGAPTVAEGATVTKTETYTIYQKDGDGNLVLDADGNPTPDANGTVTSSITGNTVTADGNGVVTETYDETPVVVTPGTATPNQQADYATLTGKQFDASHTEGGWSLEDLATANGGRGGDGYAKVGLTTGEIWVDTGDTTENGGVASEDSLIVESKLDDGALGKDNDNYMARIGHGAWQVVDANAELSDAERKAGRISSKTQFAIEMRDDDANVAADGGDAAYWAQNSSGGRGGDVTSLMGNSVDGHVNGNVHVNDDYLIALDKNGNVISKDADGVPSEQIYSFVHASERDDETQVDASGAGTRSDDDSGDRTFVKAVYDTTPDDGTNAPDYWVDEDGNIFGTDKLPTEATAAEKTASKTEVAKLYDGQFLSYDAQRITLETHVGPLAKNNNDVTAKIGHSAHAYTYAGSGGLADSWRDGSIAGPDSDDSRAAIANGGRGGDAHLTQEAMSGDMTVRAGRDDAAGPGDFSIQMLSDTSAIAGKNHILTTQIGHGRQSTLNSGDGGNAGDGAEDGGDYRSNGGRAGDGTSIQRQIVNADIDVDTTTFDGNGLLMHGKIDGITADNLMRVQMGHGDLQWVGMGKDNAGTEVGVQNAGKMGKGGSGSTDSGALEQFNHEGNGGRGGDMVAISEGYQGDITVDVGPNEAGDDEAIIVRSEMTQPTISGDEHLMTAIGHGTYSHVESNAGGDSEQDAGIYDATEDGVDRNGGRGGHAVSMTHTKGTSGAISVRAHDDIDSDGAANAERTAEGMEDSQNVATQDGTQSIDIDGQRPITKVNGAAVASGTATFTTEKGGTVTVSVNDNGTAADTSDDYFDTVTYVPATDYVGQDAFTVTTDKDGDGTPDDITVKVEVVARTTQDETGVVDATNPLQTENLFADNQLVVTKNSTSGVSATVLDNHDQRYGSETLAGRESQLDKDAVAAKDGILIETLTGTSNTHTGEASTRAIDTNTAMVGHSAFNRADATEANGGHSIETPLGSATVSRGDGGDGGDALTVNGAVAGDIVVTNVVAEDNSSTNAVIDVNNSNSDNDTDVIVRSHHAETPESANQRGDARIGHQLSGEALAENEGGRAHDVVKPPWSSDAILSAQGGDGGDAKVIQQDVSGNIAVEAENSVIVEALSDAPSTPSNVASVGHHTDTEVRAGKGNYGGHILEEGAPIANAGTNWAVVDAVAGNTQQTTNPLVSAETSDTAVDDQDAAKTATTNGVQDGKVVVTIDPDTGLPVTNYVAFEDSHQETTADSMHEVYDTLYELQQGYLASEKATDAEKLAEAWDNLSEAEQTLIVAITGDLDSTVDGSYLDGHAVDASDTNQLGYASALEGAVEAVDDISKIQGVKTVDADAASHAGSTYTGGAANWHENNQTDDAEKWSADQHNRGYFAEERAGDLVAFLDRVVAGKRDQDADTLTIPALSTDEKETLSALMSASGDGGNATSDQGKITGDVTLVGHAYDTADAAAGVTVQAVEKGPDGGLVQAQVGHEQLVYSVQAGDAGVTADGALDKSTALGGDGGDATVSQGIIDGDINLLSGRKIHVLGEDSAAASGEVRTFVGHREQIGAERKPYIEAPVVKAGRADDGEGISHVNTHNGNGGNVTVVQSGIRGDIELYAPDSGEADETSIHIEANDVAVGGESVEVHVGHDIHLHSAEAGAAGTRRAGPPLTATSGDDGVMEGVMGVVEGNGGDITVVQGTDGVAVASNAKDANGAYTNADSTLDLKGRHDVKVTSLTTTDGDARAMVGHETSAGEDWPYAGDAIAKLVAGHGGDSIAEKATVNNGDAADDINTQGDGDGGNVTADLGKIAGDINITSRMGDVDILSETAAGGDADTEIGHQRHFVAESGKAADHQSLAKATAAEGGAVTITRGEITGDIVAEALGQDRFEHDGTVDGNDTTPDAIDNTIREVIVNAKSGGGGDAETLLGHGEFFSVATGRGGYGNEAAGYSIQFNGADDSFTDYGDYLESLQKLASYEEENSIVDPNDITVDGVTDSDSDAHKDSNREPNGDADLTNTDNSTESADTGPEYVDSAEADFEEDTARITVRDANNAYFAAENLVRMLENASRNKDRLNVDDQKRLEAALEVAKGSRDRIKAARDYWQGTGAQPGDSVNYSYDQADSTISPATVFTETVLREAGEFVDDEDAGKLGADPNINNYADYLEENFNPDNYDAATVGTANDGSNAPTTLGGAYQLAVSAYAVATDATAQISDHADAGDINYVGTGAVSGDVIVRSGYDVDHDDTIDSYHSKDDTFTLGTDTHTGKGGVVEVLADSAGGTSAEVELGHRRTMVNATGTILGTETPNEVGTGGDYTGPDAATPNNSGNGGEIIVTNLTTGDVSITADEFVINSKGDTASEVHLSHDVEINNFADMANLENDIGNGGEIFSTQLVGDANGSNITVSNGDMSADVNITANYVDKERAGENAGTAKGAILGSDDGLSVTHLGIQADNSSHSESDKTEGGTGGDYKNRAGDVTNTQVVAGNININLDADGDDQAHDLIIQSDSATGDSTTRLGHYATQNATAGYSGAAPTISDELHAHTNGTEDRSEAAAISQDDGDEVTAKQTVKGDINITKVEDLAVLSRGAAGNKTYMGHDALNVAQSGSQEDAEVNDHGGLTIATQDVSGNVMVDTTRSVTISKEAGSTGETHVGHSAEQVAISANDTNAGELVSANGDAPQNATDVISLQKVDAGISLTSGEIQIVTHEAGDVKAGENTTAGSAGVHLGHETKTTAVTDLGGDVVSTSKIINSSDAEGNGITLMTNAVTGEDNDTALDDFADANGVIGADSINGDVDGDIIVTNLTAPGMVQVGHVHESHLTDSSAAIAQGSVKAVHDIESNIKVDAHRNAAIYDDVAGVARIGHTTSEEGDLAAAPVEVTRPDDADDNDNATEDNNVLSDANVAVLNNAGLGDFVDAAESDLITGANNAVTDTNTDGAVDSRIIQNVTSDISFTAKDNVIIAATGGTAQLGHDSPDTNQAQIGADVVSEQVLSGNITVTSGTGANASATADGVVLAAKALLDSAATEDDMLIDSTGGGVALIGHDHANTDKNQVQISSGDIMVRAGSDLHVLGAGGDAAQIGHKEYNFDSATVVDAPDATSNVAHSAVTDTAAVARNRIQGNTYIGAAQNTPEEDTNVVADVAKFDNAQFNSGYRDDAAGTENVAGELRFYMPAQQNLTIVNDVQMNDAQITGDFIADRTADPSTILSSDGTDHEHYFELFGEGPYATETYGLANFGFYFEQPPVENTPAIPYIYIPEFEQQQYFYIFPMSSLDNGNAGGFQGMIAGWENQAWTPATSPTLISIDGVRPGTGNAMGNAALANTNTRVTRESTTSTTSTTTSTTRTFKEGESSKASFTTSNSSTSKSTSVVEEESEEEKRRKRLLEAKKRQQQQEAETTSTETDDAPTKASFKTSSLDRALDGMRNLFTRSGKQG